MSNARQAGLAALLLAAGAAAAAGTGYPGVTCDGDSDCCYVPESLAAEPVPALVVLHCNGAVAADLDSFRLVADSLGWVLASCHATRNRRDALLNDGDILNTIDKLLSTQPVDAGRVFLFGYSGQGVQALLTMTMHPEVVRGVVSVCGHRGGITDGGWAALGDNLVYLVTREDDWNRGDNEALARLLQARGIVSELVTTPGKHDAGPRAELLEACRWLDLFSRY